MRLRFRGYCWDEASTPAMPPPISLGASRLGQQGDPLQSFNDLVQSEGLEAPFPHRLPRRPQPAGNLSSWSCTLAVKHCWPARDRGRLGSEERGGGEDLSRVRHPVLMSSCLDDRKACPLKDVISVQAPFLSLACVVSRTGAPYLPEQHHVGIIRALTHSTHALAKKNTPG